MTAEEMAEQEELERQARIADHDAKLAEIIDRFKAKAPGVEIPSTLPTRELPEWVHR